MSERIEFSGFARVAAGYLDTSKAEYEGYSDSLSLSEQSLFALQGDLLITDKLSFSTQLLAHTSDERDSGVEWMYLSYNPSANWSFKLGKLRTPFFRYSDVIDVGYSYPWITPPQQVYSGFLFSNYEGVSGTYKANLKDTNFEFEAYYGKYQGTYDRAGDKIDIDVNEIKGAILTARRGNLSARISTVASSDFFADIPQFSAFADALEFAGYRENAEAFRFNGEANAYQASLNYDTLDYFLVGEFIKIESDLISVPEVNAYYFTAGYNISSLQIHASYGSSRSSNSIPENQIPKNLSTQLTELSFAYDAITQNLPLYDLDSITLGVRWDVSHNMSAKGEVTFLNGEPGQNSFYSEIIDEDFDRKATLYQIGLEWFF